VEAEFVQTALVLMVISACQRELGIRAGVGLGVRARVSSGVSTGVSGILGITCKLF
jgi:hypothetical protein